MDEESQLHVLLERGDTGNMLEWTRFYLALRSSGEAEDVGSTALGGPSGMLAAAALVTILAVLRGTWNHQKRGDSSGGGEDCMPEHAWFLEWLREIVWRGGEPPNW